MMEWEGNLLFRLDHLHVPGLHQLAHVHYVEVVYRGFLHDHVGAGAQGEVPAQDRQHYPGPWAGEY